MTCESETPSNDRENRLIAVEVERIKPADGGEWAIYLQSPPSDDIPARDMIVSVLNPLLLYNSHSSGHA